MTRSTWGRCLRHAIMRLANTAQGHVMAYLCARAAYEEVKLMLKLDFWMFDEF